LTVQGRGEFLGRAIPMTITPRHYAAWTANDVAKLKDLAQKFPTSVVARELGRTTPAIVRKARALKLSMKVKRPARWRRCGKPDDREKL
jgi:hypothetical protein